MNKAKKAAIAITVITLTCKLIGFFKNTVLAYYYGSSPIVDAYVMVFAIGNIVFGWLGGFTGNFIPLYLKVREESGEQEADFFINNLRNWLAIIVILFCILFEVYGSEIVHIVAPGFSGETLKYTISFWRIYCFSLLFSMLYRLYKEYLNSKSMFVQAIAPDLLMSSMIMVAIVFSAHTKDVFLIWGYVIAIAAEALIEMTLSLKSGHKISPFIRLDNNIKLVLITVLPIFLSDCLTEINTFVDKYFASGLKMGSVAVLDYAGTLKNIFVDVGVVAITTMIYPKLSDYWVKGDKELFVKTVFKGLKVLSLLFLPVTFGIFLFGDNIVDIILKHGAFNNESAKMTTTALWMYSVGLLAMVFRLVLNRAFLAMRQSKVVFITGVVNVVVNIAMNFILVKRMGHNGLALATSMAAIVVTFTYMFIFFKKLKITDHKCFAMFFFKVLLASIIMMFVLAIMKNSIETYMYTDFIAEVATTVGLTVVGVVIYYVELMLLRVKEITWILSKQS